MRLPHVKLLLSERRFKSRPGGTRKTARRLALTVASLSLLVFLVQGSASAQGSASTQDFAIVADEASLSTLDWQKLSTQPRVIVVRNGKNVEITLRAQINDQEKPGGASKYLKVEPAEMKLAAAGTAEFKVTAQGQPPELASAAAFLTITGQNSNPIIRKLTVEFPGSKRVPEPAVNRLYVRVWRIFPAFISSRLWPDSFVLPLKQEVLAAPAGTNRKFILSRSQGGIAVVRWPDSDKSSRNGTNDDPYVVLKLEGVDHAGVYDGPIDFRARPVASSVAGISSGETTYISDTITVYATDIVVWPVIVILIGIALVQGTKWYIDFKRQIWAWRKEEADLGVSYRLAKQKFAALADDNHLYTIYSIEKSLAETRKDILQRIQRVDQGSTMKLADGGAAGESISEKLRSLSQRIAAWAQFPVSIIRLRDEIAKAYPLAAGPVDPPKLIATASAAVVGGPLKIDDLEKKGSELVELSSVVAIWGDLYRRFTACTRRVRELKAHEAATSGLNLTADEFERLRVTLNTVQEQLWSLAPENDEKLIQTITEGLISVETILKGLTYSPAEGLEMASVGVPINAGFEMEPITIHDPPGLIRGAKLLESERAEWRKLRRENDGERSRFYQAQLRKWDILTLIVAAAVTIITGLQVNYFGVAFGTLKDYATLFVWSVGLQAAMTLLPTVLEKILPSLRTPIALR